MESESILSEYNILITPSIVRELKIVEQFERWVLDLINEYGWKKAEDIYTNDESINEFVQKTMKKKRDN